MHRYHRLTKIITSLLVTTFLAAGIAAADSPPSSSQDEHGFRVVKVRLSAAGHMVDVRYWVDDPEKAWPLLRDASLVLEHEASELRLRVPTSAFVGPLAQNGEKPKKDRRYFILFANPGGLVKAGETVRLHIGELAFGPFTVTE